MVYRRLGRLRGLAAVHVRDVDLTERQSGGELVRTRRVYVRIQMRGEEPCECVRRIIAAVLMFVIFFSVVFLIVVCFSRVTRKNKAFVLIAMVGLPVCVISGAFCGVHLADAFVFASFS